MKGYTIKQGNHRSGYHFSPVVMPKRVEGQFRLPKSNTYSSAPWNQLNKIAGLSCNIWPFWDGQTLRPPHHWDSFRLAWRPRAGSKFLELYAYFYADGYRKMEHLTNFQPGDLCHFSIKRIYDAGFWKLDLTLITQGFLKHIQDIQLRAARSKVPTLGYWLYPYFGGTQPAPQDFRVELDIGD